MKKNLSLIINASVLVSFTIIGILLNCFPIYIVLVAGTIPMLTR